MARSAISKAIRRLLGDRFLSAENKSDLAISQLIEAAANLSWEKKWQTYEKMHGPGFAYWQTQWAGKVILVNSIGVVQLGDISLDATNRHDNRRLRNDLLNAVLATEAA